MEGLILHNEEHQYFLGDIKFHNTLDSLLILQKKKRINRIGLCTKIHLTHSAKYCFFYVL